MARKTRIPKVSQAELDKFEMFIIEMDDVLEPFVEEASDLGYQFDYTIESLDDLERYLLAYGSGENKDRIWNRAARYLGEVFRKNIGGRWELCIDPPNNVFYLRPIIAHFSSTPVEFCPLDDINGFLVDGTSGWMRQLLANYGKLPK